MIYSPGKKGGRTVEGGVESVIETCCIVALRGYFELKNIELVTWERRGSNEVEMVAWLNVGCDSEEERLDGSGLYTPCLLLVGISKFFWPARYQVQ